MQVRGPLMPRPTTVFTQVVGRRHKRIHTQDEKPQSKMHRGDTQKGETCAGAGRARTRDTPTGRWASSWSSLGTANHPERAMSQASWSPGSRERVVLRLMKAKSPGVRNPELPRTQLTCRLSWIPAGKRIIASKAWRAQAPCGSQALTEQGKHFHSLRNGSRPSSQRNKENPKGRSLLEPTPANGPPRTQLPDPSGKNKTTKRGPHPNCRTAQPSPASKLEARMFTLHCF